MYSKAIKRKSPLKHLIVYVLMTVAVALIVTLITMLMLGFKFNNGSLEQNAFLQFSTSPSGATVTVDGKPLGSKTPNKYQVSAGKHEVVMWRDGYDTWRKSVDVKPGSLTWLSYVLLVPQKLTVESVANYESVFSTLASPNGNYMLIQNQSNLPIFALVDLSSDTIKSSMITIPATLYSGQDLPGITHSFKVEKWNRGERYILVSHKYGDNNEWLVVDTQSVNQSKNITRLFDFVISNVVFSGDSGNTLYALASNDIRKLDLAAGTISKPLVSNVISFELFDASKVISYVGNGKNASEKVVGLYREGDVEPYVLRTINSILSPQINIAASRYFNDNYVAVSEGKKVDIYSGSFPNTTSDNANNMKITSSFESDEEVRNLSFSPTGEYVLAQTGAYFACYDLEYLKLASSVIEGNDELLTFKWLDDNYVWADRDGKLTIREFDGQNVHTINSVISGQDAVLTNNGRYIYSINKSATSYHLQRVRMILQ